MAKGKIALDIVKIDAEKLRNEIVKKYSLGQMAKIIGRGSNYFAPSGGRSKVGMSYEELNRICLVLGREPSEFVIIPDKEFVEPPKEAEKEEKQEDPKPDAGIKYLTSIYEGIEMNGAGIGKLLKAVEANTAALNTLIEELRKTGTTVTNWSQKWCNHKKYGRF